VPTIDLTIPQDDFVYAEEPFPALVAGYGTGKSHAAICRLIRLKLGYPRQNVAYYLPTYDLVSKMAQPRFEEMLSNMHLPYRLNKNDALIDVERRGQIIFRTMDTPERIVAYEVADSIADEIDTLAQDKAQNVWRKILGRNRQKKPDGSRNTVGVVTTPEGFKFVYEKWKKNPKPGYRLIQAATYSNRANLPVGYIEGLEADYPTNVAQAYLLGEFVNMASGCVYPHFDRRLNATTETIKVSEPLHIGMDFNVGQMAAVVFVLRDGEPHAVDELTGILDTPAMIASIKARYEGHAIFVYPDASGNSRKSNNASESDIALLRAARFTVLVNSANPAVKDRVLAMNQMICSTVEGVTNTLGMEMRGDKPVKRRLRVNVDKCPSFVEALEKQAYDKNGEPDKTSGLDHVNDAAGYFVSYKFPIRGRAMQRVAIGGI
jgi:hypothetical protein